MADMFKIITLSTTIILLSACVTEMDSKAENPVNHSMLKLEPLAKHSQSEAELRIATWNVEHLAYPIDQGCKPRTEQELQALRSYAQNLDVDIVALQEVASKEAVHMLFPENEWTVVMSDRADSQAYECRGSGYLSTQQKTAIALKKSVLINNIEQNDSFALNKRGLRFGLGMSVEIELGNIDILNLHLKSGCFVEDYSKSDKQACQTFSKQADILYDWIEQREKSAQAYIILGDFNHHISEPYNKMARTLSQNASKAQASMHITTAPLNGCHPRYPVPIDHIIVGGFSAKQLAYESMVHNFDDMQEATMLSDHCAVSVSLNKGLGN